MDNVKNMVTYPEVNEEKDDLRIPKDRLNTTTEGIFYSHIVNGICPTHGATVIECLHYNQDSTPPELVYNCLKCKMENTQKESE